MKVVAIVFGGASWEHTESIRATRILFEYIKHYEREGGKYKFAFFYVTRSHRWGSRKLSDLLIRSRKRVSLRARSLRKLVEVDDSRILELRKVDVIYSTMMGTSGENGNVAGLGDLCGKVPVIGCGILASALCLDKVLTKQLAKANGVPIVDYLLIRKEEFQSSRQKDAFCARVKERIGFPCFLKPTNLGTCFFVHKIRSPGELRKQLTTACKRNKDSTTYLVEKFIDNLEVRVFCYEDLGGKLHVNDNYVTELNVKRLENDELSESLFHDRDNRFPSKVRKEVVEYSRKLFQAFGLSDYARIDFFVCRRTQRVYLNEINTQMFMCGQNIKDLARDGLPYGKWFDVMVQRNLK